MLNDSALKLPNNTVTYPYTVHLFTMYKVLSGVVSMRFYSLNGPLTTQKSKPNETIPPSQEEIPTVSKQNTPYWSS
jgi:hypothetical protein